MREEAQEHSCAVLWRMRPAQFADLDSTSVVERGWSPITGFPIRPGRTSDALLPFHLYIIADNRTGASLDPLIVEFWPREYIKVTDIRNDVPPDNSGLAPFSCVNRTHHCNNAYRLWHSV